MRLRLVPQETKIDFFKHARLTFGASLVAMVLSFGIWFAMGLNFGIDFLGGTTIRTESSEPVDVGAYRAALEALDLGDVSITEVFDPTFGPDENVAMIRIQAQDGAGKRDARETITAVQDALRSVYPAMSFPSVESVGPKVSGELIRRRYCRFWPRSARSWSISGCASNGSFRSARWRR
jgi:preprotein translocase subunit SecF